MRISIDLYDIRKRFGEEDALKMIKAAGFDCVDYSFYWLDAENKENILGSNYREHALQTRQILDQLGLVCNQAHAPLDFRLAYDEISLSNTHYCEIIRSMEAAAILGADQIIVHPLTPTDDRSVFEVNLEYYMGLEPYCEEFGIRIAIENLMCPRYDDPEHCLKGHKFGTADTMREIIKELGSPWFVGCVDVGHAILTGTMPETLIADLDNQLLTALHIHDNDSVSDLHMLPYLGKLNWEQITKSLADIQYQGDITLEVFGFLSKFEDVMMESVLRMTAATGRHICRKIQQHME